MSRISLVLIATAFAGLNALRAGEPPAPSCTDVFPRAQAPDGLLAAAVCCSPSGEASPILVLIFQHGAEVARSPFLLHKKRLGDSCEVERLEWLDSSRVGLLCAYNPYVKDYVVLNTSAQVIGEYIGDVFAWSPDRRMLARVGIYERFGTPAGLNSCLYFNYESVFPQGCDFQDILHNSHVSLKAGTKGSKPGYTNIHTINGPLAWAPDSEHLAFILKVFNWQYSDPYSRYLDGVESAVRYYLAVASPRGGVLGCSLATSPGRAEIEWLSSTEVALNGVKYDVQAPSFAPIE